MSDFDPSTATPDFDPSSAVPEKHVPSPPVHTSQTLGFMEGAMKPIDNAAAGLSWLAHQIPSPYSFPDQPTTIGDQIDAASHKFGLPTAPEANQVHQDYFAQQEQQAKPGKIGEFAGNVAGTIPLLATGMGPIAGGATSGALLSDDQNPIHILENMALGAAGSKAGELAINKLAIPAAQKVGQMLQPVTQKVAPYVSAGTKYVQNLMDASGKGLNDLESFATQAGAKPVTAAEAIGPTGISAISALARRQGATGEAASALLGERATGTPERILGDYAQAAGVIPDAAQGNIDKLVQVGRANVKPLFDQALSAPGPVWNSDLEIISRRPVVQNAIKSTVQDLLNADTHPGVLGLPSGPDEGKLLPTAQAWDLIRKNVNDQIERDPFGKIIPDSASRGNYNVNKTAKDLTAALKTSIPGYADALDASGDYLSMQKAFQDGQKFILSPTFTASQMAKYTAKLTPPELEAFKGGTANALYNKAQTGQLHPSIFKRPILQEKLNTVLGPDKAQPFLQGMQVEANMARAGARMAPGTNSITGEVMNATNEQDKNWLSSMFSAMKAAQHGAHGNLPSAAAHGLSALQDLGIFTKASTMPIPVRDEAGRLLLMKPQDLVSHLKTLYGKGDSAGVQRVTKFLAALKAPAQVALPALAVQSASGSP